MATAKDGAQRRTRVERMLNEARVRAADSELLSASLAKQSDADYLLRLLAFEVLLKATHLVHVGDPRRSHSYGQLFSAFSSQLQEDLVKAAVERMTTSADYSDVAKLLSVFSRDFISLRYPYEAYEGGCPRGC
jgi:HEPN domain-containing protein